MRYLIEILLADYSNALFIRLTDQQSLSKSETALLNYNGDVTWLSPKVLKTYCYLEEKASIHKCEIRVGPGIHSKQVSSINYYI